MPKHPTPEPNAADSTPTADENRDELPGVRFKKGRHAQYTYEQWDTVYKAWAAGERSLIVLARRFRIDSDTIGVWARKGVASKHRPSFHDRLRDENDIVREAKAKASERMATELVDERQQVRQGNLKVLLGLRGVVAKTLGKAIEKFDTVTWTKKERITVMVKKRMMVQLVDRPLDSREYASILRQLSGAMALIGKMESFFVGDVAGEDEIPEELKFTPAELDYMAKHDGEIPPGMTMEQMVRKAGAWCGVEPMKGI
jgi:hypothetical protein